MFSAEGHPTIVTTVNPQRKGLYADYRVQDIDEFKAGYLEDTYGYGGPLQYVEMVQKK